MVVGPIDLETYRVKGEDVRAFGTLEFVAKCCAVKVIDRPAVQALNWWVV